MHYTLQVGQRNEMQIPRLDALCLYSNVDRLDVSHVV
jgi:hypothetical protein